MKGRGEGQAARRLDEDNQEGIQPIVSQKTSGYVSLETFCGGEWFKSFT